MPLQKGDTFAGYRIQRPLGSGGMGEVYLVQHPRLPRREALKVLRPDISSDPSFRERFVREADLAAGLNHANVVGIHDRGEHRGHLWIAMDYIEGPDAGELLRTRYPAGMPVDLVLDIIVAVASALDHAHRRVLLHRDVKPDNIFVSEVDADERRVFLGDFGIARPLDGSRGITETNMTIGTVAYAAPEQLMGEPLDGRADQYALAVTAFQLLTGVLPYEHSNHAVVISHHLTANPPALSRFRPDLATLDPVLVKAFSKSPHGRFPRCIDFAAALVDASNLTSASATPNQTTAPASVRRQLKVPTPKNPTTQRQLPPTVSPSTAEEDRQLLPPTRLFPARPIPPPRVPRQSRKPLMISAMALVTLLVAALAAVGLHGGNSRQTQTGPQNSAEPTTPLLAFASMTDVVNSYYKELPDHPDNAWNMIVHDAAGGDSAAFVDFWSRIESVQLLSVNPRDSNSVTARLHYIRKDGGTDTEDRWITLIQIGNSIKLEKSGRIGSVSAPSEPANKTTVTTSATVTTPAKDPKTEFVGEWATFSTDNLQMTLAPDGSVVFTDRAGWDKVDVWSGTWSLSTATTAMIVLQKELELTGNFEFGHYIGQDYLFVISPNQRTATISMNNFDVKLCRSLADCSN